MRLSRPGGVSQNGGELPGAVVETARAGRALGERGLVREKDAARAVEESRGVRRIDEQGHRTPHDARSLPSLRDADGLRVRL